MDVWLKPTWKSSGVVLENPAIVREVKEVEDFIPQQINDRGYDFVINTQWGMEHEKYLYIQNALQCYNIPTKHEIINYLEVAYRLGYMGEVPEQWVGEWIWTGSETFIDTGSEQKISLSGGKTIGIHSGCFGGVWEKKQWGGFSRLIGGLLANDFHVVNFGVQKEDITPNGLFAPEVNLEHYEDLAGTCNLPETIMEMLECDYFISNDSGLMHIADALGIPTIGIFGPTLVVKNRPINKNSLVIQATKGWKEGCIPCQYTPNFKNCESNECLKNISADFVFDQFLKLRKELNEKEIQKEPQTS